MLEFLKDAWGHQFEILVQTVSLGAGALVWDRCSDSHSFAGTRAGERDARPRRLVLSVLCGGRAGRFPQRRQGHRVLELGGWQLRSQSLSVARSPLSPEESGCIPPRTKLSPP